MIVLKVPYDRGGGKKSDGARYGPDAIEKEFNKRPWRTAEDGVSHPAVDFSNVAAEVSGKDALLEALSKRAGLLLERGEQSFIALTGDNSCAFYTIKGVIEHFPDPHLVVLDAHFDACDDSHDPHASWVRRLWEEGVVLPERTFFFGVRDPEEAELAYVKSKSATLISCDDIRRVGPTAIVSNLMLFNKIIAKGALVVVVDIDVLDPAYAPATGVLRSGGLDPRHIFAVIREFSRLPFKIKIGEITEVIPAEGNQLRPPHDKRSDPAGLTVLAADAILREMLRSFV